MATQVETQGIDPVPRSLRHGSPKNLFTLWFAPNLGVPAWLLGVLAIGLGLSPLEALLSVVIGNLVAALLLSATSALGPAEGLGQIPQSRRSFGRRGAYVPAFLNALSTLGWFAVNTVLGAQAFAQLVGGPFWLGLVLMGAIQLLVALFGHDMIHTVERVATGLLIVLFLVMSVFLAPHVGSLGVWHPGSLATFAGATTIIASYLFSWAPYGADYSRYLPPDTPRRSAFMYTFWGGFISCVWVELLGILAAVVFGQSGGAMPLMTKAMGHLAVFAMLAVVLGTLTANALNLYTSATAALTLDLRLKRWQFVVLLGVVGTVASWFGNHGFTSNYENFLYLLSYWVAPWLGIVIADGYLLPANDTWWGREKAVETGFFAFIIGLLLSIPFMSQSLFTGPLARSMGGLDLAYPVGGVIALVLFLWVFSRRSPTPGSSRA